MKIIAFANSRYKKIALNWVSYLQTHGISNYTIYALDHDTYDFLSDHRVNAEFINLKIFGEGGFDWAQRMKFIFKLLESGETILHSDLDAIWVKNPLEFISSDYDIISSTGMWPPQVSEKNGFALCMGWIYLSPSDIVKSIFNNIFLKYPNRFDDQWVFNVELFSLKTDSKFNPRYKELKLKVLDQSIVSRAEPHNSKTYVVHPQTRKGIDREQFLKDKNLWNLND